MIAWQIARELQPVEARERLKLILGCLLYPGPTRRWLSYLRADRTLWQQACRFPQFVTRIYRPYGVRHLTCRQRVALMIDHYTALQARGLRALLEASVDAPAPLVTLTTRDQRPADLRLVSVHDGHREGEAHLQLHWEGQRLYSLSFLLQANADGFALLVTRLQGAQIPDARAMMRLATKGLHGLRPAALMLHAARQVAHSMGCDTVLLLPQRLRVALNPARRRKMSSHLDALWLEMGALRGQDGLFRLPAGADAPRDLATLPSNKRAEARRRDALLAQCLAGIEQAIECLRTGKSPTSA
jgi:uncharacterized protein VirK/YbjX